jgi:hypothetical protein
MLLNKRADYRKALEEEGKVALGKAELLKILDGKTVSPWEAIAAYCYDCMAFYVDGVKGSCERDDCPLFQYMPYNKNKTKRPMTDAQRAAAAERIRKLHKKQAEEVTGM